MKEHQNVHQVINQAPTALGLSLYRKATTPTRLSPKTGRSRTPLDDCGCLSRVNTRLSPFTPRKQGRYSDFEQEKDATLSRPRKGWLALQLF